jgi:3-oxoacyl-[acyl-carrier-protein] synthase II
VSLCADRRGLAASGGGQVAVTAWAVHVPGCDPIADLLGGDPVPAQPAHRAHEVLGRKGLLAKEPATLLALCAVHRALRRPAGAPRPAGGPDTETGVVASSNLGNVATVSRVVRTVHESGVRDISALDVPNASSNVIASTVAIWFRYGGPNLMVCSGATSGLDAIALASILLRAGRAKRCVVVGAEPDDEVASALYAARGGRLQAGAGAVVLEPAEVSAGVRLGPVSSAAATDGVVDRVTVGDTYGALGVIEVALGAALVAAGVTSSLAVVCGEEADGWRTVTLARGAP